MKHNRFITILSLVLILSVLLCSCNKKTEPEAGDDTTAGEAATTSAVNENAVDVKEALNFVADCETAMQNSTTVSTSTALAQAISNPDNNVIYINDSSSADYMLKSGDYSDKIIILNIPAADFSSAGKIGTLIIKAVKNNEYISACETDKIIISAPDTAVTLNAHAANVYIDAKNVTLTLNKASADKIFAPNASAVIKNMTSGTADVTLANGAVTKVPGDTVFSLRENVITDSDGKALTEE